MANGRGDMVEDLVNAPLLQKANGIMSASERISCWYFGTRAIKQPLKGKVRRCTGLFWMYKRLSLDVHVKILFLETTPSWLFCGMGWDGNFNIFYVICFFLPRGVIKSLLIREVVSCNWFKWVKYTFTEKRWLIISMYLRWLQKEHTSYSWYMPLQ